jgi:hypothetical protein
MASRSISENLVNTAFPARTRNPSKRVLKPRIYRQFNGTIKEGVTAYKSSTLCLLSPSLRLPPKSPTTSCGLRQPDKLFRICLLLPPFSPYYEKQPAYSPPIIPQGLRGTDLPPQLVPVAVTISLGLTLPLLTTIYLKLSHHNRPQNPWQRGIYQNRLRRYPHKARHRLTLPTSSRYQVKPTLHHPPR